MAAKCGAVSGVRFDPYLTGQRNWTDAGTVVEGHGQIDCVNDAVGQPGGAASLPDVLADGGGRCAVDLSDLGDLAHRLTIGEPGHGAIHLAPHRGTLDASND
jgi:hypothetical protein